MCARTTSRHVLFFPGREADLATFGGLGFLRSKTNMHLFFIRFRLRALEMVEDLPRATIYHLCVSSAENSFRQLLEHDCHCGIVSHMSLATRGLEKHLLLILMALAHRCPSTPQGSTISAPPNTYAHETHPSLK